MPIFPDSYLCIDKDAKIESLREQRDIWKTLAQLLLKDLAEERKKNREPTNQLNARTET